MTEIVIAGFAGEEGAVRIAEAKKQEIRERFRADCAERFFLKNGKLPDETLLREAGAEETFSAEEGGVLAALYRIAAERKCGLRLRLREISVRQETVELCEMYRLNPYRLRSRCLIVLTQDGIYTEEILRDHGIPARTAGRLTEGLDKVIVDKEETEYLNRPEPDELYRIFPAEQKQDQKGKQDYA